MLLPCVPSSVTSVPFELTWRRAALVNNENLARAAAAAQRQRNLLARSGPLKHGVTRLINLI